MSCFLEKEMKRLWHSNKTTALVKKIINDFTNPENVVVDGYAGLGTIPVLAAKMGRRAVAVEISYCYIKKIMHYRLKAKVQDRMIIIPYSFTNKNINSHSVDAVITSPPTVTLNDKYSRSKYAWENNKKGREESLNQFLKEASRILKPRGVLIVFIHPADEDIYSHHLKNFSKEAHYIVLKGWERFLPAQIPVQSFNN